MTKDIKPLGWTDAQAEEYLQLKKSANLGQIQYMLDDLSRYLKFRLDEK